MSNSPYDGWEGNGVMDYFLLTESSSINTERWISGKLLNEIMGIIMSVTVSCCMSGSLFNVLLHHVLAEHSGKGDVFHLNEAFPGYIN